VFPDLVAVSKPEVLASNVLVWVFNSLFQRRQMLPMFPMLGPQVVGIDASQNETGDHHTFEGVRRFVPRGVEPEKKNPY
jgi:hypothetical protein